MGRNSIDLYIHPCFLEVDSLSYPSSVVHFLLSLQSCSSDVMAGDQFVFISSPLDFSSFACLMYPSCKSSDPATSDFSLTTMRCRQLIFQFPGQLLACPRTEENAVFVVSFSFNPYPLSIPNLSEAVDAVSEPFLLNFTGM